jgi:hypothetical protein
VSTKAISKSRFAHVVSKITTMDIILTLENGSAEADEEPEVIHMIPLNPSKPFLGKRVQGITDVQLGITVGISMVLFLVIVTGNVMVILAIYSYKKLQTVTNCFVCSLAVSDLLVGLLTPFIILMTIYPDAELFRTSYQCIVPFAAFTALLLASITNLTAVTVDRYIAITHPFAYVDAVTKKRAKFIVGVCWSIAFSIGFILPFVWNKVPLRGQCDFKSILPNEYYLLTTLGVPLPNIIVIIMLYILIGRVAHDQARRIVESSVVLDCNGEDVKKVTRAYRKERKATFTIAIIVLVFLFCWLPFIIFLSVDLLSGTSVNNTSMGFARVLLALLAIANSGANPIIYAFRLRNFRAAFWKLFTRSRCCCHMRRSLDLDFSRTNSDHVVQRYQVKNALNISTIFRCKSEDLFPKNALKDKPDIKAQSNPNLHMFVTPRTNVY